jgi:hypothetical protein
MAACWVDGAGMAREIYSYALDRDGMGLNYTKYLIKCGIKIGVPC